jgi:5-methylthioribose kinase
LIDGDPAIGLVEGSTLMTRLLTTSIFSISIELKSIICPAVSSFGYYFFPLGTLLAKNYMLLFSLSGFPAYSNRAGLG